MMRHKMKFKKLLAVALIITMMSSLLGCSYSKKSDSSASGGGASSGSSTSTLQNIIKNGKIKVGIMLTTAPFGMYDDKKKPTGLDVDYAQALADSLGVELELVDMTADNRIPSLETGKVDVVVGCFTITLERSQKIAFTDPYLAMGSLMMVSADSKATSYKDLAGKKVGVVKSSANEAVAKSLGVDFKIVTFDATADADLALENGQIDARIEDSTIMEYDAKEHPDKFKVIGENLTTPSYCGFGVAFGDQVWLNYLNEFIFEQTQNGFTDKTYKKWFGKECTMPLNPTY